MFRTVKSNVAIASAITAYARIHMLKYKLNPNVLYTDTDSAYSSVKLEPSEIGKGLGLMKDELKGNVIREAYFFGNKQYAYWYFDKNEKKLWSKLKIVSVFAGVKRNSLTWQQVLEISKGHTVTKNNGVRFYKNLNDLEIQIKNTTVDIKRNSKKTLIGNDYQPLHVELLNNNTIQDNINGLQKLGKFIRSFKKFFKKYLG